MALDSKAKAMADAKAATEIHAKTQPSLTGAPKATPANEPDDDLDAMSTTKPNGKSIDKHKQKAVESSSDEPEDTHKDAVAAARPPTDGPAAPSSSGPQVAKFTDILNKMASLEPFHRSNKTPKNMDEYKFWKTQPVPSINDTITEDGPIKSNIKPEDIRQDPYPLTKDFEWVKIDVNNDGELKDVYELLSYNYVEAEDASIRFDYTAEFLRWAMMPPGWSSDWHLGVRVVSNRKLVGFICATPAKMHIQSKSVQLVEINFLCVHKKLRSKRLAPVLIKEITRRVNLHGIYQAVYTAGAYLPKPVTTCRYYHRSLNPKKLVETKFSSIPRNQTMSRMIRLLKLPEDALIPGFRKMVEKDVPAVTKLLKQYLAKFAIHPEFTKEEVAHYFLPVDKVVFSYVVEENKKVTDFVSFYSLPSSVIGNPKHSHIYAAYLYHYAPRDLGTDPDRLKSLIKDALIMAKQENFDVFNCLTLMDNSTYLDDLKFGKGDGDLHYYFFNYMCRDVEPKDMGVILL